MEVQGRRARRGAHRARGGGAVLKVPDLLLGPGMRRRSTRAAGVQLARGCPGRRGAAMGGAMAAAGRAQGQRIGEGEELAGGGARVRYGAGRACGMGRRNGAADGRRKRVVSGGGDGGEERGCRRRHGEEWGGEGAQWRVGRGNLAKRGEKGADRKCARLEYWEICRVLRSAYHFFIFFICRVLYIYIYFYWFLYIFIIYVLGIISYYSFFIIYILC